VAFHEGLAAWRGLAGRLSEVKTPLLQAARLLERAATYLAHRADAPLSLSPAHRAGLDVLAFPKGLNVDRAGQLLTRETTSPFSQLRRISVKKSEVVPPRRAISNRRGDHSDLAS
jgi:hypothetical protein